MLLQIYKNYKSGARPEGTLLQSEATKRLSPIVLLSAKNQSN